MHDEQLIKIHRVESTYFKYFSRAMKEFKFFERFIEIWGISRTLLLKLPILADPSESWITKHYDSWCDILCQIISSLTMGDAAEFTVLGKITGDILAVVTGKTVGLLTIFGWSAVKKNTHTYRYAS